MKPDTLTDSQPATTPRRRYSQEFKQRVVRLSLMPGASAAKIALKHQVNTNLLFKWRRRYLREMTGSTAKGATLLPVTVHEHCEEANRPQAEASLPDQAAASNNCSHIEIELPEGRIVVKGSVSSELVRSVVQIVRSR